MAPKKGSKGKKGKKEVLPPPSTFADGNKNYYIGGWSSFSTLNDISSISQSLIAAHTKEDRQVDSLPRTNVLILPKELPDFLSVEEAAHAAATGIIEDDKNFVPNTMTSENTSSSVPDEITELILADKMEIEGVPYLTIKHSLQDQKVWIAPPKVKIEEEVAQPRSSVLKDNKKKKSEKKQASSSKKRGTSSSEKKLSEEEPEVSKDPPPADTAAPEEEIVAAATPPSSAPEQEGKVVEEEVVETHPSAATLRAYEEELERLSKVECTHGALFSSTNAMMDGVIRFVGVPPQIVVKPILPTPPVRDDPDAGKKGKRRSTGSESRSESMVVKGDSAASGGEANKEGKKMKGKKKTTGGKKGGKKVKLTQEELEEIEKKMAEEDAKFLKDTEEAIEKAKEEEEYLMTFAHPNRWAHVTVSGVTFTGPVQVVRAHIKFLNCCFSSLYPNRPQLMVHQYCRVECVSCTFQEPRTSSVYGLPASHLTLRKCLFTGIPQRTLVEIEGLLPAALLSGEGTKTEKEKGENSENEDDEVEGGDKTLVGKKQGVSHELPQTAAVEQLMEKLRQDRSETVGVFTDCSKVDVEHSRFLLLGFGALLHGKYRIGKENKKDDDPSADKKGRSKGKPSALSRTTTMSTPKKEALGMLLSCHFNHIFGSGICIDKTADDVLLVGNVLSECEYYALDLRQGSRNISAYRNRFLHKAAVYIRAGVHPQMIQNQYQSMPIDDNKRENPCLETHY